MVEAGAARAERAAERGPGGRRNEACDGAGGTVAAERWVLGAM